MPVIHPSLLTRLAGARAELESAHTPALSVSALAARSAMSRFHFIRRFSMLFGEAPLKIRTRSRLRRARELLAAGTASVTEICLDLGYASLGSFSSLFRQQTGESPLAFRRRYRALAEDPAQRLRVLQPACITLMMAAWAQQPEHFSRSVAKPGLADLADGKSGVGQT